MAGERIDEVALERRLTQMEAAQREATKAAKLTYEEFRKMNGTLADIVRWRSLHSNEHEIQHAIAAEAAKAILTRDQWRKITGIVVAIGGVAGILLAAVNIAVGVLT